VYDGVNGNRWRLQALIAGNATTTVFIDNASLDSYTGDTFSIRVTKVASNMDVEIYRNDVLWNSGTVGYQSGQVKLIQTMNFSHTSTNGGPESFTYYIQVTDVNNP